MSRLATFNDLGRHPQFRRGAPAPLAGFRDEVPIDNLAETGDARGMNTYPGGKNAGGVYQTIINQMPPHDVYIEPFLGSGAILRLKRPAPIANIGIDSDAATVKTFTATNGDSAGVTLLVGDGIRYLQERRWSTNAGTGETGSTKTLVYCDPPYLMSSRRRDRPIYWYEMSEQQHIELLGTLKALPCLVMISGYESPLYRSMLERWRLVTFTAMTRGGISATECLWMNYPEPTALHDYRFIGRDFRERERIKRRVLRWEAKLRNMPALERIALSGAIAKLGDARSLNAGTGDTSSYGEEAS